MRPRNSQRARAFAVAVVLAAGGGVVALACGDLGVPAFDDPDATPGEDGVAPSPTMDAGTPEAEASVALRGVVLAPDGGPLPGALVAIEVGGLDQANPGAVGPDGSVVPTLKIDPYYRYGAIAGDAGEFSAEVPDLALGLHVYATGYSCAPPGSEAVGAEAGAITLRPTPLAAIDGAPPAAPIVTEFTIDPVVAAPGEEVTLTALVKAADPATDPLSEQVLAIEPASGWAGVFAPPTPGTPGVGYPDGVYGRLFVAPTTPGLYTLYMIAATEACVVSAPAVGRLLVTASGEGGLDADDEPLESGADATLDAREGE